METKKVLAVIFSLIFVCAFAFVLVWGIINFNKVKDGMSGSGVYTKEDLNKSYEDGYNTALTDKEEYVTLIASYRDSITTLNDNVSQLTSQVTILKNNNKDYSKQVETLSTQKNDLQKQVDNLTIIKTNNDKTISDLNTQISNLQKQVTDLTKSGEDKSEQISQLNNQIINLQNTVSQLQTTNDMNLNTITSLNTQIANLNNQISEMTLLSQTANTQIASLNNKINELQKSITYYESYIAQLENGEQVVATFEFDGSVYNIQIVNKGSKLSVTTPASTDYKIFNGWKINGSIVDLSTYTINTNTKIVADITYKYDVKFKVDDTVYNNQIITKNGYANLPTNPTKTGYEFDGWSLNGVDVISDITTKQVTENITYVAVFTKLHTVTFIYENETKSTQTIRNGKFATTVNIDNTNYKIFNGWKINDTIVDLSTYKIVADTTFIADITYKYDIIFKVDNTIYNSQIVAKNGYATLPTNPTKDGYEFSGWSLNGTDIISNIDSLQVTDNVTYIAVFKEVYKITFESVNIFSEIPDFDASYLWTCENEVYYSDGLSHYKLNKETMEFSKLDWDFLLYGCNIGSFNGEYFHIRQNSYKILDKETMTWSNIQKVSNLIDIWTDGTNIYYSSYNENTNKLFDNINKSWLDTTFSGLEKFDGRYVCKIGQNIYYLDGRNNYILDKENRTWSKLQWNWEVYGHDVWTNGFDVFYRFDYILDKENMLWKNLSLEYDTKPVWISSCIFQINDKYYCNNYYSGGKYFKLTFPKQSNETSNILKGTFKCLLNNSESEVVYFQFDSNNKLNIVTRLGTNEVGKYCKTIKKDVTYTIDNENILSISYSDEFNSLYLKPMNNEINYQIINNSAYSCSRCGDENFDMDALYSDLNISDAGDIDFDDPFAGNFGDNEF